LTILKSSTPILDFEASLMMAVVAAPVRSHSAAREDDKTLVV